ncbi:MAG: hypothetical protein ACPHK8_04635, partial [Thermoplasmatota archaeon]
MVAKEAPNAVCIGIADERKLSKNGEIRDKSTTQTTFRGAGGAQFAPRVARGDERGPRFDRARSLEILVQREPLLFDFPVGAFHDA